MYNKAYYETHKELINKKRRMRHAEENEEVNEGENEEASASVWERLGV